MAADGSGGPLAGIDRLAEMEYVHGYSARERVRLSDQAAALADLLHAGTRYPRGCRVLEAGCGTGAQTEILADRNPGAES